MIKTILFDMGGTLEDIWYNDQTIRTVTGELRTFLDEHAIGRNINQIAKRVNAGGPAYQADMDEIRERLDEIWQLQRRILSSQR